jgi:hypothetical protein
VQGKQGSWEASEDFHHGRTRPLVHSQGRALRRAVNGCQDPRKDGGKLRLSNGCEELRLNGAVSQWT